MFLKLKYSNGRNSFPVKIGIHDLKVFPGAKGFCSSKILYSLHLDPERLLEVPYLTKFYLLKILAIIFSGTIFFQKKGSMSKCKKSTALQDSRFKSICHQSSNKIPPVSSPPEIPKPTSSKRWHWYTMASIRSFRACVKEVKDRKGTSAASKVKGCKTTWRSLGVIGGWGGFPPGGSKNTGRCFNNPFFFGGGCKVKTPKEAVFWRNWN